MRGVGVNEVGVAGYAADRQIVRAERVANPSGLVDAELPPAEIEVVEVEVELHGVEAVTANDPGGFFKPVWKIAGENACLHHGRLLLGRSIC